MTRPSLRTLAVSLAGCGSSSKSDDKPATLSSSDFKTQANALCKTANAEIASIEKVVGDIKSQGVAFFQGQNADPFASADEKAVEIGLPDCAGNS
jgi:hypothetical protein